MGRGKQVRGMGAGGTMGGWGRSWRGAKGGGGRSWRGGTRGGLLRHELEGCAGERAGRGGGAGGVGGKVCVRVCEGRGGEEKRGFGVDSRRGEGYRGGEGGQGNWGGGRQEGKRRATWAETRAGRETGG